MASDDLLVGGAIGFLLCAPSAPDYEQKWLKWCSKCEHKVALGNRKIMVDKWGIEHGPLLCPVCGTELTVTGCFPLTDRQKKKNTQLACIGTAILVVLLITSCAVMNAYPRDIFSLTRYYVVLADGKAYGRGNDGKRICIEDAKSKKVMFKLVYRFGFYTEKEARDACTERVLNEGPCKIVHMVVSHYDAWSGTARSGRIEKEITLRE